METGDIITLVMSTLALGVSIWSLGQSNRLAKESQEAEDKRREADAAEARRREQERRAVPVAEEVLAAVREIDELGWSEFSLAGDNAAPSRRIQREVREAIESKVERLCGWLPHHGPGLRSRLRAYVDAIQAEIHVATNPMAIELEPARHVMLNLHKQQGRLKEAMEHIIAMKSGPISEVTAPSVLELLPGPETKAEGEQASDGQEQEEDADTPDQEAEK